MREILFRGKRVEDGEWVYGAYYGLCRITNKDSDVGYAHLMRQSNDEPLYRVDPETVGQYTDLTDKNGKKIFEGDIVELEDRYYDIKWRAIVEFGNPNGNYSWGWQLRPLGKVDINTDILCWVEMEEAGAYCEVIGNIHDNPELLED